MNVNFLPGAMPSAALPTPDAPSNDTPTPWDAHFSAAEQRYGLPSGLLKEVARQESLFNPAAMSPKGARGLMQFMPATAKDFQIDPGDPVQSIDGAGRYLSRLYKQFGDWSLALGSYNWGEGNVARALQSGGRPPAETRNYVNTIIGRLNTRPSAASPGETAARPPVLGFNPQTRQLFVNGHAMEERDVGRIAEAERLGLLDQPGNGQLPQGFVPLSRDDVSAYLSRHIRPSAIGKSFQAGAANWRAGLAAIPAAAMDLLGVEPENNGPLGYMQRQEHLAREVGARNPIAQSFDDAQGVGGVAAYAAGKAAESVPYAAEFLGGAGVGAIARRVAGKGAGMMLRNAPMVGGVAASYPSAVGDVLTNQHDQAQQFDLPTAAALGVPYSLLNAVGGEAVLARSLLREGAVSAIGNRAVRMGATGAVGAAGESGTEVLQEGLNQAGRMAVDPRASMTDPAAMARYREAAIAGALVGGGVNTLAGALPPSRPQDAPAPLPAPADATAPIDPRFPEQAQQALATGAAMTPEERAMPSPDPRYPLAAREALGTPAARGRGEPMIDPRFPEAAQAALMEGDVSERSPAAAVKPPTVAQKLKAKQAAKKAAAQAPQAATPGTGIAKAGSTGVKGVEPALSREKPAAKPAPAALKEAPDEEVFVSADELKTLFAKRGEAPDRPAEGPKGEGKFDRKQLKDLDKQVARNAPLNEALKAVGRLSNYIASPRRYLSKGKINEGASYSEQKIAPERSVKQRLERDVKARTKLLQRVVRELDGLVRKHGVKKVDAMLDMRKSSKKGETTDEAIQFSRAWRVYKEAELQKGQFGFTRVSPDADLRKRHEHGAGPGNVTKWAKGEGVEPIGREGRPAPAGVAGVASYFRWHGTSDVAKMLGSRVGNILRTRPDLNADVVFLDDANSKDNGAWGTYEATRSGKSKSVQYTTTKGEKKTLSINKPTVVIFRDGAREETLLHELLHAVTAQQIAASPKTRARFTPVVAALRKHVREKGGADTFGGDLQPVLEAVLGGDAEQAVHELLAYGFTSRALQDLLKKIPMPKESRRVGSLITNAFEYFVNLIKLAVGAWNVKNNALAQLIEEGAFTLKEVEEAKPGTRKAVKLDHPAYHGTKHRVDKFSVQKIGTGEGNQAYGWGLYFASAKEVAEHYKSVLGGGRGAKAWQLQTSGVDPKFAAVLDLHLSSGLSRLASLGHLDRNDPPAKIKAEAVRIMEGRGVFFDSPEAHRAALARLRRTPASALQLVQEQPGRLYKVDLKPKLDEYLDWDKPLDEQGLEVRLAVLKLRDQFFDKESREFGDLNFNHTTVLQEIEENIGAKFDEWTGKDLYKALVVYEENKDLWVGEEMFSGNSEKAASQHLLSAGVPGLKYLDALSRGNRGGTHNFVIFDDSLIEIEEVDGVSLKHADGHKPAPESKEELEFRLEYLRAKVKQARGERKKSMQEVLDRAELLWKDVEAMDHISWSDDRPNTQKEAASLRDERAELLQEQLDKLDDISLRQSTGSLEDEFNTARDEAAAEAARGRVKEEAEAENKRRDDADKLRAVEQQKSSGFQTAVPYGDLAEPGTMIERGVKKAFEMVLPFYREGSIEKSYGAAKDRLKHYIIENHPRLAYHLSGVVDQFAVPKEFRAYINMVRKKVHNVGQEASTFWQGLRGLDRDQQALVHQYLKSGGQLDQQKFTQEQRDLVEKMRLTFERIVADAEKWGVLPKGLAGTSPADMIAWVDGKSARLATSLRTSGLFKRPKGEYVSAYNKNVLGEAERYHMAYMEATIIGEPPVQVFVPVGADVNALTKAHGGRKIELAKDGAEWRGTKVNKQTTRMWHPYSFEQGMKLMKGLDYIDAVAYTMHNLQHDVAVVEFASEILSASNVNTKDSLVYSEREALEKDAPKAVIIDKPETSAEYLAARTPGNWVQMPTGYGPLTGRYVPAPVYASLEDMHRKEDFFPNYSKVLNFWKKTKTAWSPPTHFNNIASSFVMLYMNDIPVTTLLRAIKTVAQRGNPQADALWEEFKKSGALLSSYATSEVNRDIAGRLQSSLAVNRVGQKFEDTAPGLMRVLHSMEQWKALQVVKKVGATTSDFSVRAYEMEDNIFRLAAYMEFVRREMAKPKGLRGSELQHEAGKFAADAMVNYSIDARYIDKLRRTVLPFLAWPYRMVPMVIKTMLFKPWKIAMIWGALQSLNMLGYAVSGGDEEEERADLPEYLQGNMWLFAGAPKVFRLPTTGEQPTFFNVSQFMPLGDIAELSNKGFMGLPWPQFLMPSGPLAVALELVGGYNSFTNRPLHRPTDGYPEKVGNTLDHAWKAFSPNVPLPFNRQGDKLWDLVRNKHSITGDEFDWGTAILSMVGPKVVALDQEEAGALQAVRMRAIMNDYRSEIRRIAREELRYEHPDMDAVREKQAKLIKDLLTKIRDIKGDDDG